MAFVHLHAHSYYSFYDGTAAIEHLLQRTKDHGMPALALTDYNGVYGAARFVKVAQSMGVKPIIGAEINVSGIGNLILLASSARGYSNLCKILSRAAKGNSRRGGSISTISIPRISGSTTS